MYNNMYGVHIEFFDFESNLNKENEHVFNLAMAKKVCKKCADETFDKRYQEDTKNIFLIILEITLIGPLN